MRLLNFQTLHPIAHGTEADAEQFGGLGAVVAGFLQGLLDNQPFHIVEIVLHLGAAEYKTG